MMIVIITTIIEAIKKINFPYSYWLPGYLGSNEDNKGKEYYLEH